MYNQKSETYSFKSTLIIVLFLPQLEAFHILDLVVWGSDFARDLTKIWFH